MRIINISLALWIAMSGCVTSSVDQEITAAVNQHLASAERQPRDDGPEAHDLRRRLEQIYKDRPDFLAVIARQVPKDRLPRIRSMVAPEYPISPFFARPRATVTVAFAVDEEGRVKEPRVLESSDTRFDRSAIDGVRKWRFLPGSVGGKPAMFVMFVPIHFEGSEKYQ